MTENNSVQTELSTESSVNTDAISTPEVDAVVSESSNDGEALDASDGVESTSTNDSGDDLFYDLDGEEVSVAQIREWKNNGLMQADYTKKTQVAAEVRKQAEAASAQTAELNAKLSETLSTLEQSIKDEFKSIDWDYLRENDTGEYLKQKELMQLKAKKAVQAKADLTQRQEAAKQEKIAQSQKLFKEANPSWLDKTKMEADIKAMDEYVVANGFSEDMINELSDHRIMQALLDASRYRQLQGKSANTSKAVQSAPNVIKASKKTTPAPSSRAERFYGKAG